MQQTIHIHDITTVTRLMTRVGTILIYLEVSEITEQSIFVACRLVELSSASILVGLCSAKPAAKMTGIVAHTVLC